MDTPETLSEQMSRVQMMASDDGDTWDLSDNDRAALKAVLAESRRLAGEVDGLERELKEARHLLGRAAMEINCAGPVHERIQTLRQNLSKDIFEYKPRAEAAEAEVARLEGLVRNLQA